MTIRTRTRRTPRQGRLPAAEAALIPERLLDAATALFVQRGYANTSMDAIARQAGASSKTVYSRFANKEEVLRAVVRRLFDRAIGGEGAADPGVDSAPRPVLLRIGRELAALSAAPTAAGVNRLIMGEAFQVPELAELFIDLHERACGLVRGHLERWRKEGTLPHPPRPSDAAIIFVEMVASLPRLRALLGRPLAANETDRRVSVAVDLFLRGCGYPAVPRA
jgi:AcrR family transcriptional regulator